MVHTLNVRLHDRHVGTITNLVSDHNVFIFDPAYLAEWNAPVLSLGFLNAEGKVRNPSRTPQVRLHPFFSNLLPEGHLREYLAARARVNPVRDFPLLWLTGRDLPGAVIIEHVEGHDMPDTDGDNVVSRETEDDPSVLKFSLAGVQLKFSAVLEADKGLTIPLHGLGGEWMLKMPSSIYLNVPENEFSMLTFARHVGIEVPEIALVDPTTVANMPQEIRSTLGRGLLIRRFDRADGQRLHIEDFNQIFSQYPADKYKNVSYGNVLRGIWSSLGQEATAEFVRRLVFTIGIGNGDMHLKNWSVIYRDGVTPTLTAAYDYVATRFYIPADRLALSIVRTKEWSSITFELLERFARHAEVPPGIVLGAAREMVARMSDSWAGVKHDLELSAAMVAAIDAHMASVPIFAGGQVYGTAPENVKQLLPHPVEIE
jgi:serine/threonine-protein kinase HipA